MVAGNAAAAGWQGSLNGSYQAASPGETIVVPVVASGAQTIDWRPDMANRGCDPFGKWGAVSTAGCVTFELSGGVTFGTIEISSSGVFLKGACGGSTVAGPGRTYSAKVNGEIYTLTEDGSRSPDHVTVSCIDANSVATFDARNVYYRNLDAGGRFTTSGCGYIDPDTGQGIGGVDESKIGSRRGVIPSQVVWESIYFHDVNRTPAGAASDCHDGALFFINGNGITLSRNVFSQVWVYSLQAQNFNGLPMPTNVTIENNWFGCGVEPVSGPLGSAAATTCNGQSAIQIDNAFSNWLVRFNSVGPGTDLISCYVGTCPASNVRVIGNAGAVRSPCMSGVTYAYNAFLQRTCGATDVLWNGSYVSTTVGAEDFHLAGPSNADGLVTGTGPDYQVTVDIDGNARSLPTSAGSDQRGTTTPPPPPACPGSGLMLTKIAETVSTVTFGWQPVTGAIGYRFSSSSRPSWYSVTWDPTRSTVKFSKGSACYRVESVLSGPSGGASGLRAGGSGR